MNDRLLEGKVGVVTGGGSGMGAAAANAMAQAGARVVIAGRDAAKLDRFPLIGVLQNAAVALSFAARHPERVEKLILVNGYARGRAVRENAPETSKNDPFIALLDSGGWGDPHNGFMRAWATMAQPTTSQDEITQFIEIIAKAGSPEDAIRQRALIDKLDVTAALENVQCPTIVLHNSQCTIHPLAEGKRLAAGIDNAEFVQFDSANAIATSSDPTIDRQIETIKDFLNQP